MAIQLRGNNTSTYSHNATISGRLAVGEAGAVNRIDFARPTGGLANPVWIGFEDDSDNTDFRINQPSGTGDITLVVGSGGEVRISEISNPGNAVIRLRADGSADFRGNPKDSLSGDIAANGSADVDFVAAGYTWKGTTMTITVYRQGNSAVATHRAFSVFFRNTFTTTFSQMGNNLNGPTGSMSFTVTGIANGIRITNNESQAARYTIYIG